MSNPYSPEAMKARLLELQAEKRRLQAELAPLKAEYDRLANGPERDGPRQKEVAAQIKAARAPIIAVMEEMALLAKATGARRLSQARRIV
jgi:seryl-tRNA synthetase